MINSNEGFLRNGKDPVLAVMSAGHALHVFINGQLSGEQHCTGLKNFSNTFQVLRTIAVLQELY